MQSAASLKFRLRTLPRHSKRDAFADCANGATLSGSFPLASMLARRKCSTARKWSSIVDVGCAMSRRNWRLDRALTQGCGSES
eukprot:4387015-Pyramimonas_sp.AAC.1